MSEKYLPIGTVCRLKNATKNVMITGFCVVKQNDEDQQMYDYSGCIYPQGVISSEYNIMFDHSDIDEILYQGYSNDEEKEFKKQLNEGIQKILNSNNSNS